MHSEHGLRLTEVAKACTATSCKTPPIGVKYEESRHKHTPSHAHILVLPVDGMYAAAGEQPFPGIMCCVITRTWLLDTAHLNELLLLFLKIIHPFIPTPLTHIKNDFLSKFNSSKGEERRCGGVLCATLACKTV